MNRGIYMDNYKKFLTKVAMPSAGVFTYTTIAAMDLGFYIKGNNISFEKDPFLFLLILFVFALIPLVLTIGSLIFYIGCTSTKNNWLSMKSRESAENYEKARKENEEYNS